MFHISVLTGNSTALWTKPLSTCKKPSSQEVVTINNDNESVIQHLLKLQSKHKEEDKLTTMAGRRDIHESIRLLLGKNTKVLLKVPVKLELKHGDKTENRILVFTPHRLFIVTAKVPSRIDHQFHYLDIRCVESKAPNHIAFSFANLDKTFSFRPNYEQLDQSNSASTFDRLIQVLADAVRRIFPGMQKSLNSKFLEMRQKIFVKVCLRFNKAVQISLQFDEFFLQLFSRCSTGAYHWKIRGDSG